MCRLNSILCILLWILLLTPNAYPTAPPPPLNIAAGLCGTTEYYEQIRTLWSQLKPVYQNWIKGSAETPYNLYKIQGETNNLLKYSEYCLDLYILDELSELYLGALDTLNKTDDYIFNYYPGSLWPKQRSTHKLKINQQMWLDKTGQESILVSSQFLYLISETLIIISGIEPEQHTLAMQNLLADYPTILLAHYDRWIIDKPGPFQVRGWGCKVNGKYVETGMNHQEFITKKLHRHLGDPKSPSYCNAVRDIDMWIIAGVTNLIVYQHNSKNTLISPEKFELFIEYVHLGVKLLKSRVTYKPLQNWTGEPVQGANFDLGAWDDHQTYEYAGYKAITYPKKYIDAKVKFKATGVGWDLSHAQRFVHAFESLYRNKKKVELKFPTKAFMEQLSNQLLYGVFNNDFKKPLLSNFWDGSNGWYRIGYAGRDGFGFGPWDKSIAMLTGGYAFWIKYNCDYEKLFCALNKMLKSNDPEVQKHLFIHFAQNHWNKLIRVHKIDFQNNQNKYTQVMLIRYLPSLCYLDERMYLFGRNNTTSSM